MARVKATLHRPACADSVPACREAECAELETFLTACLTQQRSGAVYISGVPGTGKDLLPAAVALYIAWAALSMLTKLCWAGKTLCVNATLACCCGSLPGNVQQPQRLDLNCMALPAGKDVFARLLAELQEPSGGSVGVQPLLCTCFCPRWGLDTWCASGTSQDTRATRCSHADCAAMAQCTGLEREPPCTCLRPWHQALQVMLAP